jgi:pimeloyl-ACP methyl ester carboxylesterase
LPLFATQARLGEAALATARRERNRCRAAGLAGSLRGMGTGAMAPLHGSLSGLKLPVLLVVGEEDEKFRAIARELADVLPDARIAILPAAGHAAHLENPVAFAERLDAFWSDTVATAKDASPDERRPRAHPTATETSR